MPGGKVVRGVMSNGYEWLFTILHLNENGRGGGYKVSEKIVINFAPDYPNHVDGNEADIIASILAHWVCHCIFLSTGHVHEHVTGAALLR